MYRGGAVMYSRLIRTVGSFDQNSISSVDQFPPDILTGVTAAAISTSAASRPSLALESDEFEETFDENVIGIELQDVSEATGTYTNTPRA